METNILGNLQHETKHQSQNVYDENGCAPTVMAGTHGYGMGYVKEQQIVAMRGRDKDNPSDRTVGNQNLEQRLEPNTKGTSNTITSVQKDNLVLEKEIIIYDDYNSNIPKNQYVSGTITLQFGNSAFRHGNKIIEIGGLEEKSNQRRKVYDKNAISPTLQGAMGVGGGNVPLVIDDKKIKIREANKKGYAECEIGGVADLNYTSSTTRRGRVQRGGADKSSLDNGEYP